MADLKTKFVGLELRSPIIAGSCGLTADINKMQEMANHGVGAIILKSIFEEQIRMEASQMMEYGSSNGEDAYIQNYVRGHNLQEYIDLIKLAKERLKIPVIASMNCIQDGEWVAFAKELEKAGADAIELNAFILPLNAFKESAEVENVYYEIVKHVKAQVNIPIIMKISHYFTNLSAFVDKLKACGANAVTLFNRFYEPDININEMTVGVASVFSTPEDIRATLRWTGLLAGKDERLQISASTGVHDGEAVVKMILAGATTVQVCSEIYEDGAGAIRLMNIFLSSWMDCRGYKSTEEFRRKLSYADMDNAARYERAQFMKYFSNKK